MVAQMLISLVTRRGGPRLVARAFSTHVAQQHMARASATTVVDRRAFHATVSARKSAVEEDLDTALESILGEAFPQSNGIETEEPAPHVEEAAAAPSTLVRTFGQASVGISFVMDG